MKTIFNRSKKVNIADYRRPEWHPDIRNRPVPLNLLFDISVNRPLVAERISYTG